MHYQVDNFRTRWYAHSFFPFTNEVKKLAVKSSQWIGSEALDEVKICRWSRSNVKVLFFLSIKGFVSWIQYRWMLFKSEQGFREWFFDGFSRTANSDRSLHLLCSRWLKSCCSYIRDKSDPELQSQWLQKRVRRSVLRNWYEESFLGSRSR